MNPRVATCLLNIFVLVSAVNSVCNAQSRPLLTHHMRDVTLRGSARSVGRLPEGQLTRLVLVLPLRNQDALNQFLKELYDPSSASFHKYLRVEEFTEMFGPTEEDYEAVLNWAKASGLTVVATSRNRVNVDVTGPVAAIEGALHVKMTLYQHPTENRTFYAPDREPTVDLPNPLWHITGLDNYATPQPAITRRPLGATSLATTGSCPEQSFCGSDMRAAYYGGTALTGSGQSLGLLEYEGTDLADLATYYANTGQTYNPAIITLLSTDGTSTSCTEPDCDDTEQTLDMTQSRGMAPGLSSLVMYVGSSDSAMLNAMATADPLNAQLSSSWFWFPADPDTDDPYFQEFAAQGQNFFEAAGDDSKWVSSLAFYPVDDDYITSVGGTDLETTGPGGAWASESAWSDGGGGISPNKFAIPFWQTTTASGCSSCSNVYRNGPDISANSNFTFYVCADQTTCSANLYGGTSFAAPMWAGYLALVNEEAAIKGIPPLGFINPALYDIGLSSSYDTDFHDVTSGSNGFSATIGYDLATGWGSPNGSGLIAGLLRTINKPGFGLTSSNPAISVVQGALGASTTITSTVLNGFDSAISLSSSGEPTGVTVTFSPTSITGAGTSTMSLSVSPTTAIGTYNIKVTGTSGSITEIVTVSLSVSKAPANFTISASPTSVSVPRGGTGSTTVTTAVSGGFDYAVTLSATGYPIGVIVSFSPKTIAAPGSGSSTMEIAVGQGVALGSHTITINATGGGVPRVTQVTIEVLSQ